MTVIHAEEGFVIVGAERLTPGQACGVAFAAADQGDEEIAQRIRKAASEADQQAETADSPDQR